METVTITDWEAGNFICTTITDPTITNVTYVVDDCITLTN
jgi:hypothetical protein